MDLVRSIGIFNPDQLHGAACTIVGMGAVGSAVFLQLAKLGVTDFALYDHDTVAPHNIGNQLLFGPEDVGISKVVAAHWRVRDLVDCNNSRIKTFVTKVGRIDQLDATPQHVFMCVDSMAARKQITDVLKFRPHILGVHDSRLSARTGSALYYDPRDYAQCKEYEDTLFADSDVLPETVGCGTSITMLPTVLMLASTLVWNFINAVNNQPVNLETTYATDYLALHASRPSETRQRLATRAAARRV